MPAVVQQHDTGEVLMLGWMDDEALARTLETGRATYWSPLPAGVLGQGRDVRPRPAGHGGPARLRRRHAAGQGRPDGGRPATPATAPASTPTWCTVPEPSPIDRRPAPYVRPGRRGRRARAAPWPRWPGPGRGWPGPTRPRRHAPLLPTAADAGEMPLAARAEPGRARLLGGAAGDPRGRTPGGGRARPSWPRWASPRPSWSASPASPTRSPRRCARPGRPTTPSAPS